MENPIVLNIQKYSIHDGEGIRTTVFFKGCPLSCTWCHNPESQCYRNEFLYYAERCNLCGQCIKSCTEKSLHLTEQGVSWVQEQCTFCERCLEVCPNGAREIAGKEYTVKELVKEIEKDRMFYDQSQGGVTLSGGEVMTQDMDYIEALVKNLKKKGYHIAIDTCGMAPWSHFERLLPYVDLFLYDVKCMNPEEHQRLTGAGNQLILENLKRLSEAKKAIYLRLPLIKDINDGQEEILQLISYIKKEEIALSKIFLLPYHHTGMSKYARLRREYKGVLFEPPSEAQLKLVKEMFCKNGFINVQIGG